MKTGVFLLGGTLLAAVFVVTLTASPAGIAGEGFELAQVVPDDVFMYTAQRPNTERDFIDGYWGEVFEALDNSGVGGDVMSLVGSLLGSEQAAEVQRLKDRALELIEGVDWKKLEGTESAFAQKFVPPTDLSNQRPPIFVADMVWIMRGSREGAEHNHAGLVAILDALAEEINKATGTDAMVVDKQEQNGAEVASLNLLAMVPGAPKLPLSVARRANVLVIGFREHLFGDVLALMDGSSSKRAQADEPRFKDAFAKLPAAEDSLTFFDMQDLLVPLRGFFTGVIGMVGGPRDSYRNTAMSAEVRKLNGQALSAYQDGDARQALALTKQAYATSPDNAIVLYNLACFNSLCGNREEALSWLQKAVEGGFYAPKKISGDPDLESLHAEPEYTATLARAAELAAEQHAEDVVINSSKTGEAARLGMQAMQAYNEKEYERALELTEQAYAVAPHDSRVLYGLACFHALLGHDAKALDFLAQAVEGGFYCPRHIARDPDLESIRDNERYQAAVKLARQKAAEVTAGRADKQLGVIQQLVERIASAVGILDYAAAIETTDGYATYTETVSVLVPDAKERPFYQVFGKSSQLTEFDRYLPQETVSFSISGGLDLNELYKFFEDTFRQAGPQGEELLDKWAGIQEQIGIDVQKDVIGWIGSEFINITLDDNRGSVFLMQVADEQVAREKVGAAIEFLSTKLTEVVAENPMLAGLAMMTVHSSPAEHEQLPGFQSLHFAMSPQPAVWGVSDGYLVFATSADAAALCLATARGDHPNIRENARVMSETIVPQGPFASVTLTDRRNLGDELAAGVGVASMVTGMMGAMIPEPKARPVITKIAGILAKLAPVVRKIDFYKSAASHTTFDGRTWHTRAVTHYFAPEERTKRGPL
ncbi:MAG: hypothetical protein KKB50_17880 [Planctomycetes bacterium]|nr:hypothetical protein [Planctomycetota bacterium]